MAKKTTKKNATKKSARPTSMSARLRAAMERLSQEWDLSTVPTAEIISEACRGMKKADREAFAPSAVQVSIVKREFTGGSPTGKVGRPSHKAIGLVAA